MYKHMHVRNTVSTLGISHINLHYTTRQSAKSSIIRRAVLDTCIQTNRLADVLILIKTLFGNVTLFEFDTEFQVLFHNLFVRFRPLSMLFTLNRVVKSIQSSLLLSNIDELCIKELSFLVNDIAINV